jgi:phosphoacetylglucosamine mutase
MDAASRGDSLAVGIMITASHNEEKDNGLKFIAETGEMLTEAWETVAARVANASEDKVAQTLLEIGNEHKVDWSKPAKVQSAELSLFLAW